MRASEEEKGGGTEGRRERKEAGIATANHVQSKARRDVSSIEGETRWTMKGRERGGNERNGARWKGGGIYRYTSMSVDTKPSILCLSWGRHHSGRRRRRREEASLAEDSEKKEEQGEEGRKGREEENEKKNRLGSSASSLLDYYSSFFRDSSSFFLHHHSAPHHHSSSFFLFSRLMLSFSIVFINGVGVLYYSFCCIIHFLFL